MELKPYQQQVINDLALFLEKLRETKSIYDAFYEYWSRHPKMPVLPSVGKVIEPYKNNVPSAPHVCVKVPTAGGKTFIACNAIKTIFNAFYSETKAVVWLVPSITILEQTINNLKNPSHPYRQKINSHFGNKVEVYDKNALLNANGFNPTSVREQLSIFVLSFDSLRAKNKEDRKVYQENGNLQTFTSILEPDTETSLMNVINALNPVVIVDESHNAESELSVEMLKNLNPSFILDLTATPRKNSNIISFIDALELKKENMVKLPVIYYNHEHKSDVIISALQLRNNLERQAIAERAAGGKYIRPIILFQAQPKTANDNTTFEKIREKLVELKIPAEQIKIKTASINEIKGVNLMSEDCPVRYIITVNALKEGWDCPFAYILASLADKSSPVDVEQIVGRVLRQPYVNKHDADVLNLSYVFTASSKYMETLGSIVKGLNKAGFSEKDFKVAESSEGKIIHKGEPVAMVEMDFDFDMEKISEAISSPQTTTTLVIEKLAKEQSEQFNERVKSMEEENAIVVPADLQMQVKTYKIKSVFREEIQKLKLPRFYIEIPVGNIFNEEEQLFDKEELLKNFRLSKCDSNIAFDGISADMYRVDLDETKSDGTPAIMKLDLRSKEKLMAYILDPSRKDSRRKNFAKRIMDVIGNLYPISESETKKYIFNILEDFSDEQYSDFSNHEYTYCAKIKDKIKTLSDDYAETEFRKSLDANKIFVKQDYSLPVEICPGETSKDITKSLYEKEGWLNGFEERVINEIANLPNVLFWTKNLESKQFKINGFINHYPDFIIQTAKGNSILLETKGDDRDNSDSQKKINLGKAWEQKAGSKFKYFMVFNSREVEGAYKLDEFLKVIREL
jgi:type III restriction enzyme